MNKTGYLDRQSRDGMAIAPGLHDLHFVDLKADAQLVAGCERTIACNKRHAAGPSSLPTPWARAVADGAETPH
jgi:hypothetical protein